jgi:diguanylate cyclase (GGDEF)-like protein
MREQWERAWERRVADPEAALEAALLLRDRVEEGGDRHQRGLVRLLEGSCRWRLGEYVVALRLLLEALELLDEDARDDRAAAELDLAVVHHFYGLYDVALERALTALELYEAVGSDHGLGNVFNNLGIIFYKRADLEESARAYQRSVEIRERLGDRDGVAACRNNLGKVLTDQGRFDAALEQLSEAQRTWSELGNLRGLGMAHNNLGIVHHRLDQLELAAARFEESLELKARVGDRHGACETHIHLGRVYAAQGRTDAGLRMLAIAIETAEELNIRGELAEACAAISDLNESLGEHAEALRWFKRFHEIDRALFNERSTERLQVLQIDYRLDRAEQEGATDALTGLANRRALDRRLREEFERARRASSELSVALLDLDSFKEVNDRFGHLVGDEVLRVVAGLLRDDTRAADLPARYGGEEFAVIFPDTSLSAATRAAQHVCERVRSHPWSGIHPDLAITVSVGVANAADAPDVETLLAAADRNLYLAKHAGKDRVRW